MGLYRNIVLFFSYQDKFNYPLEVNIVGEIIDIREEKDYVNKYILKIKSNNKSKKINNKKIILYTKKQFVYNSGDIVNVVGKIEKPEESRNFYGFNYRNYLKQNKIYWIMNAENSKYISKKYDGYFLIGNIRKNIYETSSKIYNIEDCNFILKILFGFKYDIEEQVKDNFKDAGISHIMAISGLHISYIILFINVLLSKLLHNLKLKNTLTIIFIVWFLILTGFSPSCFRAVIMNVLIIFSQNIYRKSNFYINIFIAFLIIIISNVYSIFNIGMLLSFGGTLGIVLFNKIIYYFIKTTSKNFNKILNIISISVSAQMLIFPIIVYYFNTISFTFFISNICISFLIGPIIILGYLSIFLFIIFKPLGLFLAVIEKKILNILFITADICSKIPFSKVYIKGHDIFLIIIYYSILIFLFYFSYTNKIRLLKRIVFIKFLIISIVKNGLFNVYLFIKEVYKFLYNNKLKINKKKILIILLIIFSMITPLMYAKSEKLQIYFVDVGQGDCTIIKIKNKSIIIDGGEGGNEKYDYGKNVLLQHLLKNNIKEIDYLIFSHFDSDHAGGLIYILENLKVKKILIGVQAKDSEILSKVIKIAKEKKIEIVTLEAGMIYKFVKDCYFEVLWPLKNNLISENCLNNNSLVLKFYYKNFSCIFTGDIEEVAENEISKLYKEKLKSDVLKVAHHGSKTSSTIDFLEYVRPKIALIGVGKNNKFSHPANITIKNLENLKIKVYRTDLKGEIILEIIFNKIFIKTKINT